MAKDVTLIDKDNGKIYPRTYMKNVYAEDGETTLETKMVTTDTEQTITARKDFNDAIYFHNTDKPNYSATYQSMMYQYHDSLDFSCSRESDGGGFYCFASFDIINKLFYVNGQKMANVGDVNNFSMLPSANAIYDIFAGKTAVGTHPYTAPANGYIGIFATIPPQGKAFLRHNKAWILQSGFDNNLGSTYGMSWCGYVPCKKGDTVNLIVEQKAISNIWGSVFVKAELI